MVMAARKRRARRASALASMPLAPACSKQHYRKGEHSSVMPWAVELLPVCCSRTRLLDLSIAQPDSTDSNAQANEKEDTVVGAETQACESLD